MKSTNFLTYMKAVLLNYNRHTSNFDKVVKFGKLTLTKSDKLDLCKLDVLGNVLSVVYNYKSVIIAGQ